MCAVKSYDPIPTQLTQLAHTIEILTQLNNALENNTVGHCIVDFYRRRIVITTIEKQNSY